MWVELRVSEFSGDPFFKTLGYEVLQAFGFVVKFLDGVVQNLVEKSLDKPVMTNNLEGASLSRA